MYLYYDKTRTLKTAISHGEPIRQKSDANIFVCLDYDFFENLGISEEIIKTSQITASVTYENNEFGVDCNVSENPELLQFEKVNSSEITYYLKSGEVYWTYQLKFDAQGISAYPGKIYLNTSLLVDGKSYAFGVAELYVEARTGLPEPDESITQTEYDIFVRKINNFENRLKTSENQTVNNEEKIKNNKEKIDKIEKDYKNGGLKWLEGIFDENQIVILYDNIENGKYSIKSLKFGDEILIINKENHFFKRITADKDYIYDFGLQEWNVLSGDIKIIPEILSDIMLMNVYEEKGNGKYSIKTEEFGDELIIINKENKLFKRFTAGYDYTYDFELNAWLIASGGGGGTGGGTSGGVVSLKTISPLQQTVSVNSSIKLKFNVNFSVSDQGTLQVYVNDLLKKSTNITEGDNEVEIGEYITQGESNVKIVVNDSVGSSASLIYQINAISLKLTSSFNDSRAYSGEIDFRFIPYGAVEKTVEFYVDGAKYNTQRIMETGTTQQQIIEPLGHGIHTLKVVMYATINNQYIEADELNFNLICIDEGNDDILISSKFKIREITQGELISIDYLVYNPTSETSVVNLYINGEEVNELVVDRTKQFWNTTNYPAGSVDFKIIANKDTEQEGTLQFNVNVKESEINIQPVTNNLKLYLSAKNRTNSDTNKEEWKYNDISAILSGFNWSTNGWMLDNNGYNVLRLNGQATVEIPYKIFATDFLSYGKTIEFEFATKDLVNINAEVLSCWSGEKGIKIYANKCILKSEQSLVETKFKEDEKIKVAFAIQTSNEQRLAKVYINGIFSGMVQYPVNDNFTQTTPVNITIGSEDVGIDIYSIRIYDSCLTNKENLNNYMADLSLSEQIEKYTRNNILDDYGQVSYEKVKNLIPTMIVTGKMPNVKGNKTNVKVKYSNPRNNTYDFEYENVVWDIQGTSSQYFPRKNYKGKFPEEFVFYNNGVPEKEYTFKADYMESSHSHNTGNAKIVTKFSPQFPTQTNYNGVRNSIYGFPILMFVRKDESSPLEYYGVYNFNNDKANSKTIGLTTENAESWEFKNNTSDHCNFLTNDFTGNVGDNFEARYPDKYTNYTNLSRVVSWVYSTKNDINKFKNEFEQYFNKDFCLFYYVMMDIMLAVDSRAKNMFLDTLDGQIWYPRWYDIDTTYGLNNEGGLQFEYGLEQTDEVENVAVYNGNKSVLWNNFGVAFAEEIATYYKNLRNQISYESMLEILQDEQIDKISENMYNTDSDFKYIGPLIEENDSTYLYVAQGNRLNHLQWWLNNRFKYLDSKYDASDFQDDFITMRLYTPDDYIGVVPSGDFKIIPYIDMYPTVKFGSSVVKERGKANEETIIYSPEGLTFNNTETIIYGASSILDIGDLSNKYARTMDFSKANKLTQLIVGSQISGYKNTNLTELQIGNNTLLEKIDVSNCSNLTTTLDLSGCLNIKEIYASGSGISGVTLASGGNLRVMKLPNVSSLIVTNQPSLTTLTLDGYSNLQTLRLENIDNAISKMIFTNSFNNLERVRITNVDWKLTNAQQYLINDLLNKSGLASDGSAYDKAVLTGKIHISGTIADKDLEKWQNHFGNSLTITADTVSPSYTVTFVNWDGTILQVVNVLEGGSATYSGETPTRPNDEEGYQYTFSGWDKLTTNVTEDMTITAIYLKEEPTVIGLTFDADTNFSMSIMNIKGRAEINWGDGSDVETKNNTTSSRIELSHTYTAGEYDLSFVVKDIIKLDSSEGQYFYPYSGIKNNMKTIKFQEGVCNVISSSLFANNKLITSVKLPKGIKEIKNQCFYNCSNLENLEFNDDLEIINGQAFQNTNFTNTAFKFPYYLKAIGSEQFGANTSPLFEEGMGEPLVIVSFTEVKPTMIVKGLLESRYTSDATAITVQIMKKDIDEYLSDSKWNINSLIVLKNDQIFNLESEILEYDEESPNIAKSVVNNHSNLKKIILPKRPKNLNNFGTNIIDDVYYPSNLFDYLSLDYCISGNKLNKFYVLNENNEYYDLKSQETIIVPNGIETIPETAFYYYNQTKTIVIPESVKTIGQSALYFGSTSNKVTLIFKSTTPPTVYSSSSLPKKNYIQEIRVPASVVEDYKTATNWTTYASIIVADTE